MCFNPLYTVGYLPGIRVSNNEQIADSAFMCKIFLEFLYSKSDLTIFCTLKYELMDMNCMINLCREVLQLQNDQTFLAIIKTFNTPENDGL